MPENHRSDRVAASLKAELALILQRGLKDPRIKMASIADVKVTADLRSAKVFVQVIGTPEDRASTVKGLQSASGFVRRELRARMSLKSIPELIFKADETAEKADRVLSLLAQAGREDAEKQAARGEAPEKMSEKTKKKFAEKKAGADAEASKDEDSDEDEESDDGESDGDDDSEDGDE
jgi:ribosome-binding factor A